MGRVGCSRSARSSGIEGGQCGCLIHCGGVTSLHQASVASLVSRALFMGGDTLGIKAAIGEGHSAMRQGTNENQASRML